MPESSRCLHLGCGLDPVDGAVNHDMRQHSPHVDVAHDLDVTPWPWGDESFDTIIANDVMEHLRVDVAVWLDECHRILTDGGTLSVRVPHYRHENAFTDPTHRKFFTPLTLDYWDRSTVLHKKYGVFYYGDTGRWWSIQQNETDGVNIHFTLKKEPKT